ncbi:MAG: hypothetical protein PHN44_08700, partial [Candidatus Marinimicrobia bacterium]|nr:hypothetical protein [Candidatus Neomarinimicrobiota bacterium]
SQNSFAALKESKPARRNIDPDAPFTMGGGHLTGRNAQKTIKRLQLPTGLEITDRSKKVSQIGRCNMGRAFQSGNDFHISSKTFNPDVTRIQLFGLIKKTKIYDDNKSQ